MVPRIKYHSFERVKIENEIDIKKEIRYPLTFSSVALFLLGISTLLLNLPKVLSLDFRSLVSAICALFIIIGVIGIARLNRWGLYFLISSLILPIILIPLHLTSQLIMLVSFINLIIFIDLLFIYKAHNCKDISLQKKLIKASKKYMLYVSIILVIIIVAAFFNVLAAAFGNNEATDVTKSLKLDVVVDRFQEMNNICVIKS